MSTEVRQIRCPSCGYSGAPNVVLAVRGFCPRCLEALPISAERPPSIDADDGEPARLRSALSGWIDAFNACDLDGLLSQVSPGVELHPLRLDGVARTYRGHAGVREWFGHLVERHLNHRLVVSKFRDAGRYRLITVGRLRPAEGSVAGRFLFVDMFRAGQIAVSYHFLVNRDTLEHPLSASFPNR